MTTIENISLDKNIVTNRTPEIEHEYNTAIRDLLEENYFKLNVNQEISAPYKLHLDIVENRLQIEINESYKIKIPILPFKTIIKDYFIICESYFKATKEARATKLETIDMARRSLHNEGSELLKDVLMPEIEIDKHTARGLFTLICVLHIR